MQRSSYALSATFLALIFVTSCASTRLESQYSGDFGGGKFRLYPHESAATLDLPLAGGVYGSLHVVFSAELSESELLLTLESVQSKPDDPRYHDAHYSPAVEELRVLRRSARKIVVENSRGDRFVLLPSR